VVRSTPDRDALFCAQTPQVFDADILKGALSRCVETGVNPTDDCAAVEAMGVPVCTVPGEERNIKITNPEDIVCARALLGGIL